MGALGVQKVSQVLNLRFKKFHKHMGPSIKMCHKCTYSCRKCVTVNSKMQKINTDCILILCRYFPHVLYRRTRVRHLPYNLKSLSCSTHWYLSVSTQGFLYTLNLPSCCQQAISCVYIEFPGADLGRIDPQIFTRLCATVSFLSRLNVSLQRVLVLIREISMFYFKLA
eukprot:COSAG02_NODE_3532_length_6604_cov_156.941071_4_plen_168_part_00